MNECFFEYLQHTVVFVVHLDRSSLDPERLHTAQTNTSPFVFITLSHWLQGALYSGLRSSGTNYIILS